MYIYFYRTIYKIYTLFLHRKMRAEPLIIWAKKSRSAWSSSGIWKIAKARIALINLARAKCEQQYNWQISVSYINRSPYSADMVVVPIRKWGQWRDRIKLMGRWKRRTVCSHRKISAYCCPPGTTDAARDGALVGGCGICGIALAWTHARQIYCRTIRGIIRVNLYMMPSAVCQVVCERTCPN